MNDSSQLKNQFAAVVMERPFARVWSEKISPVTTQAQGPNVDAFVDVSKDSLDRDRVHFTEERDVYANKSELSALRIEIRDRSCGATGRNNVLGHTHTECPCQKNWAPSEMVDCPKTRKRHDHIDEVNDHLQDERVWQAVDILGKVACTVIDDEIDTDELLE